MIGKWIDGELWYKNEFRYRASVLRRDPGGFPIPGEMPIVRLFELRKDAEKWLKREKSEGALTKLIVSPAYYKAGG